MKIIDREYLRNKQVGKARAINLYAGDMTDNLRTNNSEVLHTEYITTKTAVWKESESQAKLRNEIKGIRAKLQNANTGYNYSDIKTLVTGCLIDIVRQADDLGDYSDVLLNTSSDINMSQIANLGDYVPYVGQEQIIAGYNDSVPLMEKTLQEVKPIEIKIKAIHKNSIRDLVFDPFYSVERLMDSVARITVDSKNDDCIGKIVTATYDANHSQAADTTGASYDLRIYNTIKKGIKKALNLKHSVYNQKKLGNMQNQIYLLVNPTDMFDIEPVINGSLERLAGVNQLVGRLPIEGVISYGGGLQNGYVWGKEILSFPGVPQGTAFIVVKTDIGGFNLVKRDLTLEQGIEETLQLLTKKRAWYWIGETFLDWLIDATVKVTLPTP